MFDNDDDDEKFRWEPEDIKSMRYMEECAKRCEEIRPQVEKLWAEICRSLQDPWRMP
jgi:hypothetical protein